FGRAAEEDVAAYEPRMLDRAASLAGQAIARHRKGESVIAIDRDAGILRRGRPVTVVTVVNDNMPFLFGSVIGEITETAGDPVLVIHPVIGVRRGDGGVEELFTEAVMARDRKADRVSVSQVHLRALAAEAAVDLEERLRKVVRQERAAVDDWKPMLARL